MSPATVELTPNGQADEQSDAATIRMRYEPSLISRSPSASSASPTGLSLAERAGPPTPENPKWPLPATVVSLPKASTRRTVYVSVSIRYIEPSGPPATESGTCPKPSAAPGGAAPPPAVAIVDALASGAGSTSMTIPSTTNDATGAHVRDQRDVRCARH